MFVSFCGNAGVFPIMVSKAKLEYVMNKIISLTAYTFIAVILCCRAVYLGSIAWQHSIAAYRGSIAWQHSMAA